MTWVPNFPVILIGAISLLALFIYISSVIPISASPSVIYFDLVAWLAKSVKKFLSNLMI